MYKIIGAGLTGCLLARLLTDKGEKVVLYEKDKVGGLCRDNDKYQEFIHVLHTDNKKVWDLFKKYTQVKPYKHWCVSYVNDEYRQWPPKEMNQQVFDEQVKGYSYKMWGYFPPKEAIDRIKLSKDGHFFPDKYQGVPNFRRLFKNLTKGIKIIRKDINCLDKLDNVILTGEIDRYFDFKFGRLGYRGMGSRHFYSNKSQICPQINYPDITLPFLRTIDYRSLGYKNYIGIEYPARAHHYPVNNEKNAKKYSKYLKLAEKHGVKLVGRLAQYKYMDMDEIVEAVCEQIS